MRVKDKVFANAALLGIVVGLTVPPDPRKCADTPPHIETPTTLKVQPVSQNYDASSQEPGTPQGTTGVAPLFWMVCAIVAGVIIYFQYFSN